MSLVDPMDLLAEARGGAITRVRRLLEQPVADLHSTVSVPRMAPAAKRLECLTT